MSAPTMLSAAPAMTAPIGGARTSRSYYDKQGRRRKAAYPVPVDQFGQMAGAQFRCRKCRISEWFPAGLKGAPVCGACERRMDPQPVRDAPMLPWRDMWAAAQRPLRPVWALPVLAGAGATAGQGDVSAVTFPALAVGAGVLVSWRARRWLADRSQKLDEDDPEGQKSLRASIAAAARRCGYVGAGAVGWLTLPAALGVPSDSAAAQVAVWGSLLAGWAIPAGAWWRSERLRREQPAPTPVVDVEEPEPTGPSVDPDEAEVLRVWVSVVAAKQGQPIGLNDDEPPVFAPRSGPLVGSWLEDWRPVTGGWAAVAVGEPGVFTAESFVKARATIASAFRMKASMITVIPDPDDENRAEILAQRSSPIRDEIRWAGPDSIDVKKGTAPVCLHADGEPIRYELYRPGWGCPHDAIFGTTGSGKSEFMNLLLTIDRWAHYTDDQGVAHGIVADFLIDPQQGQSFAPFLDDLAAPVACSLEEATLLVRALTAEMLRRNRYLAREAKWFDTKRRKWRTGRKWWDPLVDGPLLVANLDEAHDYLSNRDFSTLVTKGGRMWRKCGGKWRIATHTPLLTDLGGSMALRDMLTGGFVWVGRTANSLTGATAFNGRLPADPRQIPAVPGTAYVLSGAQPKAMLSRAMWEPDFYDWVRDDQDRPIGYPAPLPQVTLDAFGKGFQEWASATRAGELWTPPPATPPEPQVDMKAVDAVLLVLGFHAHEWIDMDQVDQKLVEHGLKYSTRTVRDALAKLRKLDPPWVETRDRRHQLTAVGLEHAMDRSELVNA